MSDAYETDFYAWAMEQAALLRAGRFAAADTANIAEEIESLGPGPDGSDNARVGITHATIATRGRPRHSIGQSNWLCRLQGPFPRIAFRNPATRYEKLSE